MKTKRMRTVISITSRNGEDFKMNTSKGAVVASSITGKIASILGYIVGGFSLLIILFGMTDLESEGAVPALIFFIIIFILSILSVLKGLSIKKRLLRFRKYVELISVDHITSLENIAASTSQSIDFVRADLQKMIDKKYFINANLDLRSGEVIIGGNKAPAQASAESTPQNNQISYETVKCPGCGATNVKPMGATSSCEYCGSVLAS